MSPAPEPANLLRDAVNSALGREIDGAIAEQLALAEREPSNPMPYCALGAFFQMQGRLDDAGMMFRHALALNPDFALAHQYLGQLLIARDDLRGAWHHAREADRLGNRTLLEILERHTQPENG